MSYGWTQPVCDRCWLPYVIGLRGVAQEPARLIEPDHERCCICNAETDAGIYIRIDPESAPHPTKTK